MTVKNIGRHLNKSDRHTIWSKAGECGFSTLGVDAILGIGCGIQGQNYIELLQESLMTAGYHYRNWILWVKSFKSSLKAMLQ